jgi:hypothetical protein
MANAATSIDPNLQSLFQRMADVFQGFLAISHIYRDGSVRMTIGDSLSVPGEKTSFCVNRRVSIVKATVPNGNSNEPVHLVKVEQICRGRDPSPMFVSPRPSAVLSVLEL